jgi:hypothetical protein
MASQATAKLMYGLYAGYWANGLGDGAGSISMRNR